MSMTLAQFCNEKQLTNKASANTMMSFLHGEESLVSVLRTCLMRVSCRLRKLLSSCFTVSVSVANEVACQSLDWLESAFPVLYTPTEQVACHHWVQFPALRFTPCYCVLAPVGFHCEEDDG